MDFLQQFPEIVAGLVGATVSLMSLLKKALAKQDVAIPSKAKPWIVAGLAGLSSIVAFQAAGALSWGNALSIVFVTALVTYLSITWHNAQKPTRKDDPRR